MDAHRLELDEPFDYIILSDVIGEFTDVQRVFSQLHRCCHPDTRVLITYTNFLWVPLLRLAERVGLKMPQKRQNWLDISDIRNLLDVTGFDIIKQGKKLLMPRYVPVLSWVLNRYVANLPLFNALGLFTYLTARSTRGRKPATAHTVSVVVPARNEKGNIEAIVQRTPPHGCGYRADFCRRQLDGRYVGRDPARHGQVPGGGLDYFLRAAGRQRQRRRRPERVLAWRRTTS
jgi:hypothetical protein